jgi:hypothetical protein
VRAEVCCYVSVQLLRPTGVVSWARGFGWEKRVPSSWGGAGGYSLAGEVEVEVRCVGAVVDGGQSCDRRHLSETDRLRCASCRSLFGRVR